MISIYITIINLYITKAVEEVKEGVNKWDSPYPKYNVANYFLLYGTKKTQNKNKI